MNISTITSRVWRKKRLILILLIIFGILYFIVNKGAGDLDKIQFSKVEQKTLKSEVIASGKVSAKDESTPHFAVSGKLVWFSVKKGDYVKKGQVIASLDREKYEIAQRQANQEVIAADAQLVKVYDDLKNKTSETASYSEKITRTAAEATKNQAVDALKLAERNLKDTVLISPINGTVVDVFVNTGQEILLTSDIVKIGDVDNLVFKAEIDETDIGKLQIGQSAKLRLDAFEGRDIETKVESIDKFPTTTSTGATAYEAEFVLQGQEYYWGMNGEASIVIEEKDSVIAVDLEAIIDDKFVWIKTPKGYEKKEISTGISSETATEITSGLLEGQEVVTSGFEEIEKRSLLQKVLGK